MGLGRLPPGTGYDVRVPWREADERSAATCQFRGWSGRLRSDRGLWWETACDAHVRRFRGRVTRVEVPSGWPDHDSSEGPMSEEHDVTTPVGGASSGHTPHALYDLADVEAALGDGGVDMPDEESGGLAASRMCLRRLRQLGEGGRWRRLAHTTAGAIAAVEALGLRAPHLHGLTDLVVCRLRASLVTGTPVVLPPLVLVGPPGVGKSWYLAGLALCLDLPFRIYPFNLTTLSDGLSGSHPGWRASAPGLVARTLLLESVANPLVLVDEIDKAPHVAHVGDPYRALYGLLEPTCSRAFVDEHLGFPIDASAVSWVAAANDVAGLPGPILDRLTILSVPEMRPVERAVVVGSIYAETNSRFRAYFDEEPSPAVVSRLVMVNPRRARLAVEEAMVRAAAAGRRTLLPDDVPIKSEAKPRGRVH